MADDCGLIDFGCKASQAVDNAWTDLANKLIAAVGQATTSLATFWMDTPDPAVTASPGSSTPAPTVDFLQGSLRWYVLAVAVLSVLVAAVRMAVERRAEPGRQLLQSIVRLIAVSGAGLTVLSLGMAAADAFSSWIVDRSTQNFGQDLVAMLHLDPGDVEDPTMTILVIVCVAVVALVVNVVQIILLVLRNGMVVLLASTWQLSAAATNTQLGRQWFDKTTGWLLAFVLYKPTAAIIYAASFKQVTTASGQDKLTQSSSGIGLMVLSLVALPALLRLAVPAVSAVSGGSGGGMAAAAGAASMVMPSGSKVVPRGSLAGGGAGAAGAGGGAPGRSGPTGSPPGAGGSRPTGGPTGGAPTGGGAAGGAGAAAGGTVAVLTRGAAAVQTLGQTSASGAGAPTDDDGGPSGSH